MNRTQRLLTATVVILGMFGLVDASLAAAKAKHHHQNGQQLAGEKIINVLDRAPGNDAAIGGIKVISENGWFAARPSGTEAIYKIYAESFRSDQHLRQILVEAQTIVDTALANS